MKTIATVAKPLINNNIVPGSFLTISNTLKQFPVLNVSYLKLTHRRFFYHVVIRIINVKMVRSNTANMRINKRNIFLKDRTAK